MMSSPHRNLPFVGPAIMILVLIVLNSAFASACPICFGETESGSADGVNAAVWVMLGITGTVLGLISTLFLRLRKRLNMKPGGSADHPGNY